MKLWRNGLQLFIKIKKRCIVIGKDLFSNFHLKKKVTEHFRGQFQLSARRPSLAPPTPQWLSLFTQLQHSDRTAGCNTPAARRPLRELWLPSDHLHSTLHLSVCVCVCVRVYVAHTAGPHPGFSNCYSTYFACGCVKLSHSLWPSEPHWTHLLCPF